MTTDAHGVWIAGEECEGARVEKVSRPFDGGELARVWSGAEGHMEAALASAHAARREARATPAHLRASVLREVSRRIEESSEALSRRLALESGKPIRYARGEVQRAATTFQLAAAHALTSAGASPPLDVDPRGVGRLCVTRLEPRGVVGAIAPFNFPLNLVAHKIAPAVAVGAPFVLKPPPQCPLSSLELARWLVEAGWPPAAVNVVPCEPGVAQSLATDPRVAVLTFTGSDSVGWKLKALAGRKQVVLELGGNAPCIVDETVDLAGVAEGLATSAFAYGGQVCIKTQRVLVHRSRHDELLEAFVAAAKALPCGDPLDENVVVGPLIAEQHVVRVLEWVGAARGAGAKVLCGGKRDGQVVLPTVILGAPDDARVVCDEVFGPVAVVEPFERFEDALARCNASRYGLQAGVYTRDVGRALKAFDELEYGGVIVNDTPTLRIDNFPYGGVKDSGSGREGIESAAAEYVEPRVLVMRGAP